MKFPSRGSNSGATARPGANIYGPRGEYRPGGVRIGEMGGILGGLTSDPFTKVLLHFDGANGFANFTDSSTNKHNFFPQNGAFLTTSQSKFGGSSLYVVSIQATGAGGVFCDGSAGLALGAGDFVVDLWYYMAAYVTPAYANSPIIDWGHDTTNNTGGIWVSATGAPFWIYKDGTGTNHSVGGTTTIPLNTWAHIAVVRASGVTYVFVNGVLSGASGADTTNYATIANAPGIGMSPGGTYSGTGFFDEVRVSIGTNRGWASGFTPPVAAYTTDANTQLLLHFDGANGQTTYTDSSGNAHTVANSAGASMAALDTSQSKFGTASAHISASGSTYLMNSDGSSDMALESGNFVVDFWFRAPSFNDSFPLLLDWGFVENAACPYMTVGGGVINWYANNTAVITAGAALSLNTWHHVALVRSGGFTKLFIDGVQSGATYTDANNYVVAAYGPALGGFLTHIHAQEGWYDEFRISKGTDRGWFGGFTPPTAAYTR